MDREVWRAVIHGVAKSRTWLSDWTELRYIAHHRIFNLHPIASYLLAKWKWKFLCCIQNHSFTQSTMAYYKVKLSSFRTHTFSEISLVHQKNKAWGDGLTSTPGMSRQVWIPEPAACSPATDAGSPSSVSVGTPSMLSCCALRNRGKKFFDKQLNVWLVVWDKQGFMLH